MATPLGFSWIDAEIELGRARIAAISSALAELQNLMAWLEVIEQASVAQAMQALDARRKREQTHLDTLELTLRRAGDQAEAIAG